MKTEKKKRMYCVVYQTSEGFGPDLHSIMKFFTFEADNNRDAISIAKKKNPGVYAYLYRLIKKL